MRKSSAKSKKPKKTAKESVFCDLNDGVSHLLELQKLQANLLVNLQKNLAKMNETG